MKRLGSFARTTTLYGSVAASLACLAALAGFELARVIAPPSTLPAPSAATTFTSTSGSLVDSPAALSVGVEFGDDAAAMADGNRSPSELAEIRSRLRERETGTYIKELLLEHDSSLARWPDRSRKPLRIWIQPSAQITDWQPWHVVQIREAFATWMKSVDIPVRFAFATDSSQADVHVFFVDRFDEPISGKTVWARDENWWIVDADISIAVHYSTGEPLDESAILAITLHEVGHLLGLDHCTDQNNIMAPRVRVRELSRADRATAELLYTLPPGTVR
jgi:predicted Zn-dependent protease